MKSIVRFWPVRGARGVLLVLGLLAIVAVLGGLARRGDRIGLLDEVRAASSARTPLPTVPALVETPLAMLPPLPVAQPGDSPARIVEVSVRSRALGRDMPANLYLPRGYDNTQERYPVLYMLHGYGGGRGEWPYYGLFEAATRLIDAGAIPPMIIVVPEGELGYWMDHADNGPRYGTYLADDVVSFIDAQYRTRPARGARAIGGLSMGADGAMDLAFHHPDEFAIVGVHSPMLRKKSEAHPFFGDQRYYDAHAPLSLVAASGDAIRGAGFALWLDTGVDDPWLPRTVELKAALDRAAIPHQWHQYDGDHGGAYWQAHMQEYLRFYGDAFRAAS